VTTGVERPAEGAPWRPRLPRRGSTARVVVLTLYYLAVITGLVLVRLGPERPAVPFVYQAF
jgi:hypothetical protein